MSFLRPYILSCLLLVACSEPSNEKMTLQVAAAANFVPVLTQLCRDFEDDSGIAVSVSSGSTGVLFAQIENGAPFDVFLSADVKRPQALIESGHAERDSAFVYAQGRLALVAAQNKIAPATLQELLLLAPFDFVMANSKLAPFGRATLEAIGEDAAQLTARGIKVIRGENVAQAWSFLERGAADYGCLPLSMAQAGNLAYQEIDKSRHEPIDQMAVLIMSSPKSNQARQFLRFLKSAAARRVIKNSGYDVEGT